MLQKLLPDELFARIQEAQVDPFRPAPESDFVPIIDGDTGDEVGKPVFQGSIDFVGAE